MGGRGYVSLEGRVLDVCWLLGSIVFSPSNARVKLQSRGAGAMPPARNAARLCQLQRFVSPSMWLPGR